MRAAMEMGTQIPKLCATDMVDAFGSCRLCLVEDRRPRRHAGILHHAGRARHGRAHADRPAQAPPQGRDGALYLRPSARLSRPARRTAIANCRTWRARSGCATCATATTAEKHPNPGKDESNPYFTYDPSKCIVCSRCVRACEEVQGTFALTIAGRGFGSRRVAGHGRNVPRAPNACPAAPACRPVRRRR